MKTLSFFKRFRTLGLTIVGILLICDLTISQELEKPVKYEQEGTYNFHIQKAKQNRTVGFIFVGLGTASFLTGVVLLIADIPASMVDAAFDDDGESDVGTGLSTGLMIGGAAVSLVSIPLFASAREHKKKANLLIGTTQVVLGNTKSVVPDNIGISLVIPID